MGLFVSMSVHRCPVCGQALVVSGMIYNKEPQLHVTECKHCQTKFQVRTDDLTGKTIFERLVKQ